MIKYSGLKINENINPLTTHDLMYLHYLKEILLNCLYITVKCSILSFNIIELLNYY